MSVLCYSPILFGTIERGVYILRKITTISQLGGVVAICYPSGGRKVRSWDCLWGHRGRVEGASSPSTESPAASGRRTGRRGPLQRKAMREAGNRAAITFRSGQWRDSVPERFAVNNSTG
ncbi:unnamed protein product [Sphagnum balticum]